MELNPGFDGKVFAYDPTKPPRIENGVVNEFCISSDFVTDISPIRVVAELGVFRCAGGPKDGKLSDRSPRAGSSVNALFLMDGYHHDRLAGPFGSACLRETVRPGVERSVAFR